MATHNCRCAARPARLYASGAADSKSPAFTFESTQLRSITAIESPSSTGVETSEATRDAWSAPATRALSSSRVIAFRSPLRDSTAMAVASPSEYATEGSSRIERRILAASLVQPMLSSCAAVAKSASFTRVRRRSYSSPLDRGLSVFPYWMILGEVPGTSTRSSFRSMRIRSTISVGPEIAVETIEGYRRIARRISLTALPADTPIVLPEPVQVTRTGSRIAPRRIVLAACTSRSILAGVSSCHMSASENARRRVSCAGCCGG